MKPQSLSLLLLSALLLWSDIAVAQKDSVRRRTIWMERRFMGGWQCVPLSTIEMNPELLGGRHYHPDSTRILFDRLKIDVLDEQFVHRGTVDTCGGASYDYSHYILIRTRDKKGAMSAGYIPSGKPPRM